MPVVQNYSPELDIDMIKDVMQAQQNAWNKGDLNQFMVGYWKSDSLMFIGKSGVNKGWDKILANYEKGYPDKETMGRLQFTNLSIEVHTPEIASVIGKWELFRSADTLSGHYSLLWKKLNQKWVIVSDHSS
ncbi:MAG: nuclear transport factor 2 family protein [Flavobacteriales bacterium]|nr:nuclear transport factor 2 family protein [Flavobacteriales bacterium]